jgi:ferric-chelate reductase (NADPH)
MTPTQLPFSAQADLPGVAFSAMRQMLLSQAKAADLQVIEDAHRTLRVQTAHGLIGLCSGDTTEVAGVVAAADERWLFVMKAAVVDQMRHVMPDVAAQMRWSNGPTEGSLPPNFMFMQVRDVVKLGPEFLRVTLQGEDVSRHGDAAIHFRLVQPPEGAEVIWPSVAANGSISWPEGPGAPHRPVYTTRYVDFSAGTLVTDVFVHEGGRTTKWAQQLMDGERARRVVGIIGPSGGGLIEADQVLMAADETGFPAAARILEGLPTHAQGEVFLEASDGAACAYPIAAPKGFTLKWLARSHGDCLADAALAALPRHGGSKIWFAGERGQATKLREAAKAGGHAPANLRVSGFWTQPDGS